MKRFLVLGLLLVCVGCGSSANAPTKEDWAMKADYHHQHDEIMKIRNLREFKRRWIGFVNRANSEPWYSALTKFEIVPERLFEWCTVKIDGEGKRYCDGYRGDEIP